MDSSERLKQISVAMLTVCLENKRLSGVFVDDLIGLFANKREAKIVLKQYLVKMDFLKLSADRKYYKITPLGKAYLSNSPGATVHYSNISNSNIAHQSPNSNQSIVLNELSGSMQKLIADFDDAERNNDGRAMMKVLGYIADKSVDVAIAMITGVLIR